MTSSNPTATSSSRGPAFGLVIQAGLLITLGATVGLSAGGWAAGAAYGIVLCALLALGLRRAGLTKLGPANLVTFARALMVGGVTAMVVTSFTRPVHMVALVTLVGVALALDGVDGQVARRTGNSTALGARFDMEIDAFLILVLSVFVAGTFGWWTVAIGAFRYLFVAASWLAPWLTAPLPPKFSRKTVAATQGVVLVVATAHILPDVIAFAGLAVALVSLTWSFARDIAWLWRSEQLRRAAAARTELPIVPSRRRVLRTPAAVG
ncbi:CDP-alcohol phosphatidyltransferase family protein [Actinoplanes sp. NBRC 103695]|uniref:CDP-alcohol phosphatidyltransferase family protein n=1 Tax=Actinoplanes sp. NBRC 103695 TaxID=3032202 RepID=UPI0024A0E253|nr:CDP-alcohol phosphatidyltransferase family protein [Actinoplanes sp. NBRC 103695]GLY97954.1 membrane protein [Actinoplanes sp. NBRC 103695]